MNEAHLHLLVNHLPIILPIVGVIVAIIGLISKSEEVKRTALLLFIFGAIGAFAAMATGEGAEEVVEHINGVTKNYIHEHEEKAELFALTSYVLGVLSVIALWASFKQKAFSYKIYVAVFVFAFVVLFFGAQTGTTGGEIRHTEIRSEAPANGHAQSSVDKD